VIVSGTGHPARDTFRVSIQSSTLQCVRGAASRRPSSHRPACAAARGCCSFASRRGRAASVSRSPRRSWRSPGAWGRIIVNDRADIALMAGAPACTWGRRTSPSPRCGRLSAPRRSWPVHPRCGAGGRGRRRPGVLHRRRPRIRHGDKDTGYPARGLDLVRYAGSQREAARRHRRPHARQRTVSVGGRRRLSRGDQRSPGGDDPETRTRAFLAL